MKFYFLIYFWK